MDDVIRAVVVYALLMLIFRLSGKRSMAETTPFDFVLLLIFSEALQAALVDGDNSLTVAFVVIVTLVVLCRSSSNVFMPWSGCWRAHRLSSSRTATSSGNGCDVPELTRGISWQPRGKARESTIWVR